MSSYGPHNKSRSGDFMKQYLVLFLAQSHSEVQAFETKVADDSDIGPKSTHECSNRRVGGPYVLGYTHRDHFSFFLEGVY